MSNLATITNNILADSGIDDINVVVTTGSYANPAWITSLAWSKITGAPLGDYLPLAGGTMTGPLNLAASLFYEVSGQYALNLQNSDIIGMNALYFNDLTDSNWEGINWYNTASSWDSLYSKSGVLYYNPNRPSGGAGTEYAVWTAQNLVNPVTGTGANTRIAYWTGSGTLSGEDDFAYDYPNNRLRINSGTWSSSAATKLLVGGLLVDGSDAIAQLNGFIRIKDQLIIHNGANTAEDAYIQAVGAGVLTVGNKLLINTSSVSSYQLDVNGTARFSGTISGSANLELTNAGGSYALIGEGTGVNQYGAIDWDSTNNRLRIATQPYAFGANGGQITLTTTGLVGIGILAPSYKLDVNGGVNNDQARFVAASGDALVRIIANNYGTEADARLFLGENDTLGMTFEYDGQNNIGHIGMNDSVDPTGAFSRRISMPRAGTDTIFGAGNVLIGTSSPNGATLQVSGRGTINAASTDYALTLQNVQDDAQGLLVRATDNDGSLYLIRAQSSNSSVSQTWVDRFTLAKNGAATFSSGIATNGYTASTSYAALFNGNVGIGTPSPSQLLHLYTNLATSSGVGTAMQITSDGAGGDNAWIGVNKGSGNGLEFSVENRDIIFNTGATTPFGGTERMRITSAGNLGLGVIPSAWSSSWRAFEFQAAAIAWTGAGANDFSFSTNSFFDATDSRWEYKSTGDGAARYSMTALTSQHRWFVAPIGTANQPITFTQAMTLFSNGNLAVGETSSNNNKLRIVGDWVSGFSTVGVQGVSANQAGYGLYNIAGTRVGVWAYTGSVIYFETETSGINMNFNPAGITSMTLEGNGNVSIGRLTSGVTRADIYLSPSSTNSQLYFGRLSSTNDDNTKVYFINRAGTAAMFVDTGAQRVQIKSDTTPNYTAYDLFVSRGDQYGGGIDVQNGLVRFRGDDDWLYINRAGTDVITIDGNNRVGIGTTSNNGKLQITGSHVGGYGMLNMNSVDSCIIAMDSSTSWDVRLRYKFQGVDYWFAGMVTDNTWRLTKGDNTAVLYATQGNNVYIPNGGLQIASEGGFTGSAKFLVGSFLSAGSSAIAQFNGFLRIRDQIIIHNNSNTGLETYLQCTGANALTTGGSITATSFFESSDVRLKTNIADYNPVNISDIAAKIYEKDGKLEIGYLAQDLQGVINSAVSERENGYLDLSYRQVHTAKIAALEAKIKQLESQLNNR